MPSSEKTPALGLNRWRGSDIPMREDFVADNNILDSAIAALQQGGGSGSGNDPRLDTHIADQNVHLSAADRQALGAASAPLIGSYTGDGQIFQAIVLGFRPRMGMVFAVNRPLIETGSNGLFQTSRAGILTNIGASRGIDSVATGFRAHQSASGTLTGADYQGLNQQGMEYVYIMWR